MRAAFIDRLYSQINNEFSVKARAFLESNRFIEMRPIVNWLADLCGLQVTRKKGMGPFEALVPEPILNLLRAADAFYYKLFRKGNYINEHTMDKESTIPCTECVRTIYNRIFLDDYSYHAGLIVYGELSLLIERELGVQVARNNALQAYEQWIKVDELLEREHEARHSWMEALSISRVRVESKKFLLAKQRRSLSSIALLDFTRAGRENAAKVYTSNLRKLQSESAIDYVRRATKGADSIHFSDEAFLQARLTQKLGITEYLTFIDQLKYPIVQHHALMRISDVEDFILLIQKICSRTRRKTPKEYLLLYVLSNYFDFLTRTLTELAGIASNTYRNNDRPSDTEEQARRESQSLHDDWKTQILPQSIDKILNIIFPYPKLRASKYLVPYFDWLCSYKKHNLIHPSTGSKRHVIDLLGDCFVKLLSADKESYTYLADELLAGTKVNQQALSKMAEVLVNNPKDSDFRQKMYDLYWQYLSSHAFWWNTQNNIQSNDAINDAYAFSLVLCSFPDYQLQWRKVFSAFRTNYQGWITTPPDQISSGQESYILTAGVGMAYDKFEKGKHEEGEIILREMINHILHQVRSCASNRSGADYQTPLCFAAATIGKFSASIRDEFVLSIARQLDSIKFFIQVVYDYLLNTASVTLSAEIISCIEQRIGNDFWLIKDSKVDVDLSREFQAFDQMRRYINDRLIA